MKNKYRESLKRQVMAFAVGYQVIFVSNIFSNLVLYTTLKSNGKFFMDLTNIEGIECLQCITVLTEVTSKLSGNLQLFCTQLCKGKKNWKCDSEELFE